LDEVAVEISRSAWVDPPRPIEATRDLLSGIENAASFPRLIGFAFSLCTLNQSADEPLPQTTGEDRAAFASPFPRALRPRPMLALPGAWASKKWGTLSTNPKRKGQG
jgi:hypothetical protein